LTRHPHRHFPLDLASYPTDADENETADRWRYLGYLDALQERGSALNPASIIDSERMIAS